MKIFYIEAHIANKNKSIIAPMIPSNTLAAVCPAECVSVTCVSVVSFPSSSFFVTVVVDVFFLNANTMIKITINAIINHIIFIPS